MADPPDRQCLPVELEMLPLYREPPGLARLRREQKREQRRERREQGGPPTRVERVLRGITACANAVTRRRRA